MNIKITKILLSLILILITSCGMENKNSEYIEYNGVYEIVSLKNKYNFSNNKWENTEQNENFFRLEANYEELLFLYCENEYCENEKKNDIFTLDSSSHNNYKIEGDICIINTIQKEIRKVNEDEDFPKEIEIIVIDKESKIKLDTKTKCNKNIIENSDPTFYFKKIEIIKGKRVY